MNHVEVVVVVVVVVVSVVDAVAAAAAEVIVTDVRNQVILHVIVLNLIHVVDKVVAVHQINKVEMMMMTIEIRCRMANQKNLCS